MKLKKLIAKIVVTALIITASGISESLNNIYFSKSDYIVNAEEEKGIKMEDITVPQGTTSAEIKLFMVNVESRGCQINIECKSPIKSFDPSTAIAFKKLDKGLLVTYASGQIFSTSKPFDYIDLEISEDAEPGTYPINFSIISLDDVTGNVENPVAYNGSVTITESTEESTETPTEESIKFEIKGLTYEKVDNNYDEIYDEIKIIDCNNYVTEIKIPAEIDSLPVKTIGEEAFCGCSDLESIIIPDSITVIENSAFMNCKSLIDITIPNSVTSIEYCAFAYCDNLKSITIPDSVIDIGNGVFESCENLENVKIGNSVKRIGGKSFHCCKKLVNVIIGSNVETIEYSAFYNCESLKEIIVPEGVTSIESSAFEGCSNLVNITIPDTVNNIELWAFDNTAWLEAKQKENPLVMVNSVLVNGKMCSGDVEIPGHIVKISDGAFWSNNNLENIIIPESVVSIGEYAFDSCTNLKNITIKNPVCDIFDSEVTINNIFNKFEPSIFNGTIFGYLNSSAQSYAVKYNYKFESLGEHISPATEPTTIPNTEETTIITTTTVTKPEQPETKVGDIDGDGEITLKDAVLIRRFIVGGWDVNVDIKAADLDGDGEITLKDAVLIRRYIVGGWNVKL